MFYGNPSQDNMTRCTDHVDHLIDVRIKKFFGSSFKIYPIQVSKSPNNEDLLAIIANQQKRIVILYQYRRHIMFHMNYSNLIIWTKILKEYRLNFGDLGIIYGVDLPQEYFAKKSVLFPKELPIEQLISFLDSQYGQDKISDLTFEDAAVITFIKPIFPFWLSRVFFSSCKDEIISYIKYMTCALKKIIENVDEVKIDIEINNYSYQACQNILIYLNDNFKNIY